MTIMKRFIRWIMRKLLGGHEPFVVLLLSLLAAPVQAQEPPSLFDWLKTHTSIVSGVALADGVRSEFVSVAVDTDFEVAPKFRGFGSLTLFTRNRVPVEGSEVGVPLSVDALSIYSSGEVMGGAYYELTPRVSAECRAGLVFDMIAFTAHSVGAPVDGTKVIAGCGARLTGGPGRLSVLGGHAGNVDDGLPLYGFLPSLIFDGAFRMTDSTEFLVAITAGRDRVTDKAVTSSRFSIRKSF